MTELFQGPHSLVPGRRRVACPRAPRRGEEEARITAEEWPPYSTADGQGGDGQGSLPGGGGILRLEKKR